MLMKTRASWLVLLFAFFGIADSAYLAESAFSGVLPTCKIGGLDGCHTVALSAYSHLFGIPLGIYGVSFYVLLFVLAAFSLLSTHLLLGKMLKTVAVFGILASFVFLYIQLFLIHAVCVYCVFSMILTILIVIAVFWKTRPAVVQK